MTVDFGGTRLTEYDERTLRLILAKSKQFMATLPPNDVQRLEQLLAGAAGAEIPREFADAQAEIARLRGALEKVEKRNTDLEDSIGAMLSAVGYTAEYALQWPKEKVSVTFKRWFEERVSAR